MKAFIENLPKAELHVHLEGTLEPEHIFALAERNRIDIPYSTPEEIIKAYDFHDLPSFLAIYYAAMNVLMTEKDFYELTYFYFEKAAAQNVVYVEPFFDPQAHTSRGIDFDTVITGIHKAQLDAEENLGVKSNLIMCFLRDLSAESALEHLDLAWPYKDWIIGVGLDSDEKDNPPNKFKEVFAKAREHKFKLTMHCDVNQLDIVEHIDECLNLIQVDRIDHGVNSLESEELCKTIAERGIGLTVCPVSNQFVVQDLTGKEIREMLERGMKATINSDDPAYFRAYMNENLLALVDKDQFTQQEVIRLTKNAFEVCWASEDQKEEYLSRIDNYVSTCA